MLCDNFAKKVLSVRAAFAAGWILWFAYIVAGVLYALGFASFLALALRGLWEAAGVFSFFLFGVSSKEAAGFTLANHALQVFPVIIVGLVSAVIFSVNIRQISFGGEEFVKPEVN